MLEIFLLRAMSEKISKIAKEKGMASWPFNVMLFVLWFGGEIGGAIIGFIVMEGGNGDFPVLAYLFALVGAGLGAAITFGLLLAMPGSPVEPKPEDELDRPYRRRRRLRDQDADNELDEPPLRPQAERPRDLLEERAGGDDRFRDRLES